MEYWFSNDQITKQNLGFSQHILIRSDQTKLHVDIPQGSIVKPINSSYSSPLLKSCLQKAIRRKNVPISVSVASQMIEHYLADFLRRLSIIMMEDCYLLPKALVKIVWLMIAVSKTYVLTQEDRTFLLDVVKTLALSEYKDDLTFVPFDVSQVHNLSLDSIMEQAVVALWFRSEYGGTKGDMKFLQSLCMRWIDRIKDGYTIEEVLEKHTIEETQAPIYFYEGVDFHCFPHLLMEIRKLGYSSSMTNEQFKQTMWFAQSGINKRSWLFPTKKLEEIQRELDEKESLYKISFKPMKPFLKRFSKWAFKL